MKRLVLLFTALTLVLMASGPAWSLPISWVLSNVNFNDGSTATGGFTFDADTSSYSNILITTSALGTTYDTSDLSDFPFGADANGIELVDNFIPGGNVNHYILNLDFVSPLTNAGGIIAVRDGFPSFEGICSSGDCSTGTILRSVIEGGFVTSAPIPEPASLVLLGTGLVGIGLAAWRRKK